MHSFTDHLSLELLSGYREVILGTAHIEKVFSCSQNCKLNCAVTFFARKHYKYMTAQSLSPFASAPMALGATKGSKREDVTKNGSDNSLLQ